MLTQKEGKLIYRLDKELMVIEPWGANSLRIRATQGNQILANEDFGLMPTATTDATITLADNAGSITCGTLRCQVSQFGVMSFYNRDKLVLKDYDRNRYNAQEAPLCSALELNPRMYAPVLGTDHYKLTVRFEANKGEKLYGMGQYQQENLDLKGCIIELAHRNSQISVPFMLSSLNYGLLWNNPAIGKVTFGNNLTEWEAESTKQMDIWITCGDSPAQLEEQYTAVTGRVPMMPDYGMGFWQSKLRYQTQDELMEVAREYYRRKIPVSVIVADYFHWEHQGDWAFDPVYWPDPAAMVRELKEMGMKLMVSIWPTVEHGSVNFKEMEEKGYLVRSDLGSRMKHLGNACYFDVTNPEARTFMWSKIKENYWDKGVRVFWLDEAEPEYTGYEYRNIRYHVGSDLEKGNLFPRCYAQMAWDGMKEAGQEEVINLARCAWVGSSRYGALAWSGDIESTFASLRCQLAAGLNISLAGIPWWTTDIGGFHNGDVNDPAFKELLIRWFQFGAFCPVFRLHGVRDPLKKPIGEKGGGRCPSGAENEIWSYGDDACDIFEKLIHLRGRMQGYITDTMALAHEKGQPVIRPIFYNAPDDPKAWDIDDEFFFGEDVLVCPVLYAGVTCRTVYLPTGSDWRDMHSGKVYPGGTTFEADAPIERIPVFARVGKLEAIIID